MECGGPLFFGWTHPLIWTAIFIPSSFWFRLDIVLDWKSFYFSSGLGGSDVFSGRKWRLLWHVSYLGAFLSCPTWRHLTVEGRASDFSCPFISLLSTFGCKRRSLFLFLTGQERWRPIAREPQPEIFDLGLYCAIKLASSKRRHFYVQMKRSCVGSSSTTARSVMTSCWPVEL